MPKHIVFICFLILFSNYCIAQPSIKTMQSSVKQYVMLGEYETAISFLEENMNSVANDTTGLFDALLNLYFFEKKWNKILDLWEIHTYKNGEDSTTITIARFNALYPKENITLSEPVELPFKSSASGTPIVEIKVNGKTHHFWFDTGAGMTVLSSKIAQQCNIKSAYKNNGIAISGTGNPVNLTPGMIDSIELNTLKVYNHPCILFNKKDLEFRVLGIRILKIDGIIGWNLLQELDVTIFSKEKKISLSPFNHSLLRKTNTFFWFGMPLLACKDSQGDSLTFFIDTGAGQSLLYESFIAKIDTTNVKKKSITLGSAGGFKKLESYELPELDLKIGNTSITQKRVTILPVKHDENLISCDGILGVSEFKNRTLHFNIKKGLFSITD